MYHNIAIVLLSVWVLLPQALRAQTFDNRKTKEEVKTGNEFYLQGDFKKAQEKYGQALIAEPNNPTTLYNIGNSLYQQNNNEEARKAYEQSIDHNKDPNIKAKNLYNMGNTYAKDNKWKEAAEAYKSALKITPSDKDTRYNLAYANEKLRQQQQQDKNQDKDKEKDKEQEKDKDKEKDKNKDQEDKDDKQDPNEQKKDGDQKQDENGKPQPSKLSKQQAENLLNALRQEEKKVQDRKGQKGKAIVVPQDKDW